jgi:hypothetical protein
MIYERRGPPFSTEGPSGREWMLLLAAALAAPLMIARLAGVGMRAALLLSGTALGLLGAALWTIAFTSAVPELRYNEVLLVFWPTDLVLPFLGEERRQTYARVRVVALVLVSIATAIGFLAQPLMLVVVVAALPLLIAAL